MSNKPSFKQAQVDFAAHIRDPQNNPKPASIEDRRMKIYRDLFISSIGGLLAGSFPVIRSLYTDASWELLVRKYFKKEHNKTPHFPEIPREFVTFLQTNPEADPNKPFLYELAHYEWLELHLEKHSIELKRPAEPISADQLMNESPVISPLARLNSYAFPVHKIKASFQPTQAAETPIYLTVWRDQNFQIHFSEMTPFSALLLEKLMNNKSDSGHQVLQQLAIQHQHPDPEQFINFGEQVITQWLQQDIIISIK
ncbi:putative DNA-binding domain-containing protein [Marinicella sp. S1101]|uniref:HvfC family RiPP maturation protein n=1 Tax=Marinicella marina TaxID=2996016 RepID=UPI002260B914|nr:putative DNA-binding domain-containing protein [Marinicella marina]MCX7555083.1 putative DNA-binding domain-containing protein [Marinicella marina]MDJ1141391.1 putative DNA-binding domain-containing protein [Marinicella marina]